MGGNGDFQQVLECNGRCVCQVTSSDFVRVLNVNTEPLCAEETVVMHLGAAELFWRIRCVFLM